MYRKAVNEKRQRVAFDLTLRAGWEVRPDAAQGKAAGRDERRPVVRTPCPYRAYSLQSHGEFCPESGGRVSAQPEGDTLHKWLNILPRV